MSHTPGPWTASQYLDNGEWGIVNKDNTIVVGVASRLSEADVKLIAAAPELLGSLRFILAFYEPGQNYLDTEAWKRAEAGARYAVAKAEGNPQP